MLCLDIKLVSRLRGISSGTASSTASSTHPTAASASSSSTSANSAEKSKSRKVKRENSEVASSTTTSDSEEELLRPSSSVQEMIRRNRSRSVCVAAILPSSQLRQLHRRASHVYVAPTRDLYSSGDVTTNKNCVK